MIQNTQDDQAQLEETGAGKVPTEPQVRTESSAERMSEIAPSGATGKARIEEPAIQETRSPFGQMSPLESLYDMRLPIDCVESMLPALEPIGFRIEEGSVIDLVTDETHVFNLVTNDIISRYLLWIPEDILREKPTIAYRPALEKVITLLPSPPGGETHLIIFYDQEYNRIWEVALMQIGGIGFEFVANESIREFETRHVSANKALLKRWLSLEEAEGIQPTPTEPVTVQPTDTTPAPTVDPTSELTLSDLENNSADRGKMLDTLIRQGHLDPYFIENLIQQTDWPEHQKKRRTTKRILMEDPEIDSRGLFDFCFEMKSYQSGDKKKTYLGELLDKLKVWVGDDDQMEIDRIINKYNLLES